MNLLAPLFLAGIAAIAVPIFVHLTHKERKDPIRFPSLMFLRRVPFRTVARQRIRHWLLFLLRVAAVALIVGAFARPLIDSSSLGVAVVGQSREVVVLLDRSYSMTHGDRWTEARNAVRNVIARMQPDDRVTIVAFADKAEAVSVTTSDPAAARASLDRVRVGGGRTSMTPALQLARDILETSDLPRREVVVVTDFQKTAWESADAPRMPPGTVVQEVHVGERDAANVGVASVVVERTRGSTRDRVRVSARLINMGSAPVDKHPVMLDIDGQTVQTIPVDVPARGATVATFATELAASRNAEGRVRVRADGMPADDEYRFMIARVVPIRVLILTHPAARSGELLYLQEALAIGDAPPYTTDVRNVTQFREADLTGTRMVLLADAPTPQGAHGAALEQWVRQGGGLMVAFGIRSDPSTWTALGRALVGGQPGGVVDRLEDRGATLSVLGYAHPVFEPFATPRSGDFSVARFLRYRRFEPTDASVEHRVLARFDDGTAALLERRVGDGHVLVWTAGIANQWNDLPLKPVFLPFIHQVARYLAAYRAEPAAHLVGQVVTVPRERVGADGAELIVETPAGDRVTAGETGDVAVFLDQVGVYRVRRLDESPQSGVALAANVDPAESDLASVDPDEAMLGIQPDQQSDDRTTSLAAVLTPGEKERRQALWWYLLLGAVGLLVVESVLARRAGTLAG